MKKRQRLTLNVYCYMKEASLKKLSDSNYMTFGKRQNNKDSRRDQWLPWLWR